MAVLQGKDEEVQAGRLTPDMRSRKLQALDFIKRYYASWGHSPTLGELAAALGGISTKRAYDLVHQLSDERQVEVVAGKTRGIRLIDRGEELSEADVLLRLSALGYVVGQGGRVILPPGSGADAFAGAAIVKGLMEKGLPDLDFVPDEEAGTEAEAHGEKNQVGTGARAAAAARGAPGEHPGGLGPPSS